MKLHYYPETDSLYIELKSSPGAEAREIVEGLVVDFDANGEVVGFDIDHASRKLDLSKVETVALPPASAAEPAARWRKALRVFIILRPPTAAVQAASRFASSRRRFKSSDYIRRLLYACAARRRAI